LRYRTWHEERGIQESELAGRSKEFEGELTMVRKFFVALVSRTSPKESVRVGDSSIPLFFMPRQNSDGRWDPFTELMGDWLHPLASITK